MMDKFSFFEFPYSIKFMMHYITTQVAPLTAAVIVTTPQKLAFIDVAKGVRMFSKLKVSSYWPYMDFATTTSISDFIFLFWLLCGVGSLCCCCGEYVSF